MSLTDLIDELDTAAIQLWLDQGQLRFRAPPGALSTDLRERIVAAKPELIKRLLAQGKSGLLLDEAGRFQPFPQTPIQRAYIVGRTEALALGGMAANSYMEFDFEKVDLGAA